MKKKLFEGLEQGEAGGWMRKRKNGGPVPVLPDRGTKGATRSTSRVTSVWIMLVITQRAHRLKFWDDYALLFGSVIMTFFYDQVTWITET